MNRSGTVGVEYGLIVFGIGLAIVVSIASLGSDLSAGFTTVELQ